MRICEANTRILRAMPQPDIDAMSIGRLAPAPTRQRKPRTAENRTLCRARALSKREAFVASGRGRRQAAEAGAYLRSKYADSPRKASTLYRCDADWTAACHAPHQRRPRRKIHPRIPAQTGMRFPDGASSGNCIPESAFRPGYTFRFTCRLKKPARPPSQNWVEESQNAIAGGQYDCRR